ncbi:zinc-dependent alcohol dehydrogenase [Haloarcula litorea]|uniref:zinc-dependent alcohol dehydrogenase n=1 Tax=Haloarcula litorea TaxID=3032579 RepID=UPI0023E7CF54|nr:zinc-binding alcohol dehydrogenase [Halomicroarcula sp. GDY20]
MTDRTRSLYFDRPGSVTVREERPPTPDAGEALVETVVSGVSPGTELLVYRGEVPEELAVDETIDTLDGRFDYPVQYGYAAVGRVREVGDGVDPDWRDRLVFGFNPHESHFCASPDQLRPVPDDIEPTTATLFPTAETAVNFVLDATPRVGERVVVFGAGPVGLTTTAVLSPFPLDALVVVDPVARRREAAERLGATETLRPSDVAPLGDRGDPPGMDLAVEVSGEPAALDDAVDAVGYDGRVVVGSWYGTKPAELALGGHFHRGRVDLKSSQVSTLSPALRGRWTRERRMDRAVEVVREHALDRLVTHRVPIEDAATAYETLAADREALSVVFTY